MTFDEALKAMRMGSKVSRDAWRGSISYWKIAERRPGDPQIYQHLPSTKHRMVLRIESEHILADDWWVVI